MLKYICCGKMKHCIKVRVISFFKVPRLITHFFVSALHCVSVTLRLESNQDFVQLRLRHCTCVHWRAIVHHDSGPIYFILVAHIQVRRNLALA